MEFFNQFLILIISGFLMNTYQSIKFSVRPKNMTVNAGDNVSLDCVADRTPLYYTWEYRPANKSLGSISTILGFCFSGKACVIKNWHSQIQITNRSRIVIQNISSLNSGRFFCETSSADGIEPITSSAIIIVKTAPKSISIHFNKSKNEFHENESITIQCSVYGSVPPPKIFLSIVDKKHINQIHSISENPMQISSSESSAIYLWKPIYNQHQAFVRCSAVNDAGNLTEYSTPLNIKYEPKIRHFSSSTISVMPNQTIDLSCDVTANPAAAVQWVIMNGLRHIDSSELITRIEPQMAGTITCRAKNSIGSRSKSLLLVVLKDPVINLQPTYKIIEHSDYSITCLVDSIPPPDFIKWYKLSNNTRSHTVLISNDAKLNFIKIDRSSTGMYVCVTQNTQVPTNGKERRASTEKIIYLVVTYKPGEPRITGKHNIFVQNGEPFILKCSYHQKSPGEPLPSLKWIDLDTREVISDSRIFDVKKSESKHNGRFQCLAQNTIGLTLSADIASVFVYESPSVIWNEMNTKIFLNYSNLPLTVSFICIFRGQPLYDVKWRYESENILSPSPDYKIEVYRNKSLDKAALLFSKLTINLYSSSFSQRNSFISPPNGRYNCETNNKNGVASLDYYLIIKYPPFIRVDSRQRKIAAVLNQNFVIIRCQAESISRTHISWFKSNDDLKLPVKSEKYSILTQEISQYNAKIDLLKPGVIESELRVNFLENDDFTNYSCISTNEQGLSRTSYEIVPKSQPDPPNDLTVKNLEWDSVTISWKPSFNGGYEQNFEIQVKSDQHGLQNVPFYSDKIENTLTITGLNPSTHYEIRVYAINTMGRSTSSPVVKCVTKRIEKFDKIRAEILSDQPKIAVVVQEPDLCANLEYTRDNGRQWFSILHCVRFNDSYINETVFLDITRITSMMDLQSGLIHLRLTFCLLSRQDVCSLPRVLENPRNDNLTTQTVILVIAVICFLLIIILIGLFVVCCIRFRYHCTFHSRYYCCGCCFATLYNSKNNNNNRHYNSRTTCDNKPLSCSRVSCVENLEEMENTTGSTSNYCSSLIGSTTPHILNNKFTSNDVYSAFICPHHEFRHQIPILYEGSSFLQPSELSWSQKIRPPSCEASSSHSHSSTGSSGRNLQPNTVQYRNKHDVISKNNIVNIKSYSDVDEKVKLPDVTSEAIHFEKYPYDDKIMEAVV